MTMKVLEYFHDRMNKTTGEIGIEIEVEGESLPNAIEKYWKVTNDGSLRGEESHEYVLHKPVTRQHVGTVLDTLSKAFARHESKLTFSDRTSVHIHLNAQEMTFEQVVSLFCLHTIFEELLMKFCGKSREFNNFCLTAKNAEYSVARVSHCMRTNDWYCLNNDSIRYSACNLCALLRYGSVEFRGMEGTADVEHINLWVNILLCLKDYAMQTEHTKDIISSLSGQGEERFLSIVFGPYAEYLQCPGMEKMMREGVRRIQELAYLEIAPPPKREAPKKMPRAVAWQDFARAVDPIDFELEQQREARDRQLRDQVAEMNQRLANVNAPRNMRPYIDHNGDVAWREA